MSKVMIRDTAPGDGGSVEHRLARLLDTPFLERVVPHLSPETLHQLIRYRGLDACGELVTCATAAQLTSLLDLDLWQPAQPGRDHLFDADRFGEWLEVLAETGAAVVAQTVAALDTDLVVVGLSRYVRVFDRGIFEPTAQSDDELTVRHDAMREGDSIHADTPLHNAGADGLECEVGGYIVRARRADAWDAIVTLLFALDADHGRYFHAVMQGCRRFSNSRPEIDGLDDLLRAPEQHLHDVTIERERRRSEQGYAAPADARAFLEMARQPRQPSSAVNPIVAAYFRAADGEKNLESEIGESGKRLTDDRGNGKRETTNVPESIEAVMELLAEAGVMPERPRALLEGAGARPRAAKLTDLRRLMAHVRDSDDTAYFTRSRELAFLANVLLAGCTVQSRPFTPQEASDAAAAICNLGLEHWPATDTAPDALLINHDLVAMFELGWSVLHRDVSLFAADQLISTLARVDCVDREIRRGLVALRRTLVKQRKAGTPWRARDAAEVLSMLDMTAWIGVVGLLDECPVLPAALTAVLEGRTTTVSPTEFDFISTAAQIGDVRLFMQKIPELLSR